MNNFIQQHHQVIGNFLSEKINRDYTSLQD